MDDAAGDTGLDAEPEAVTSGGARCIGVPPTDNAGGSCSCRVTGVLVADDGADDAGGG